jgi:hypothetical protein
MSRSWENIFNELRKVRNSCKQRLSEDCSFISGLTERKISEYAVATDALGRRIDFDPKTDASVRVQISRLRRKLKDFYETEGAPMRLTCFTLPWALTPRRSSAVPRNR